MSADNIANNMIPVLRLTQGCGHFWQLDIDVEAHIINKVFQHPHLYDSHRSDYRDGLKRATSFATIGMEVQLSGEEVARRWKSLRDRYSKERRMIDAEIKSGITPAIKRKWKYYESLQFLNDHLRPRRTSSTVPEVNGFKDTSPREQQDADNRTFNQTDESQDFNKEAKKSFNLGFGSRDIETSASAAHSPAPAAIPYLASTCVSHSSESSTSNPGCRDTPQKYSQLEDAGSELVDAMWYLGQALQRTTTKEEPSAEDIFGQYLAITLKRIPPYQRALAISKILQVLLQVEFGDGEQVSYFVCS